MKTPMLGLCLLAFILTCASAQESRGPVKVTINDGGAVIGETTLPLDPVKRITPQFNGQNSFGLSVEGKRITCTPQGSIWGSLKVDGNISNPFNDFMGGRIVQPKPLGPTVSGRKRIGTESTWTHQNIKVTQIIEVVPSKSTKPGAADKMRRLDTCRMTYILENTDKVAHKVAFKTAIDILVVNNDGALYASPTTQPGKVLNGVELKGKDLPDYLWVLEAPEPGESRFLSPP